MTTIKEFSDSFKKRAYELAIYNSLGEELSTELKAANCELVLTDTTFEFLNCPPELQAKIDKVIADRKSEFNKTN